MYIMGNFKMEKGMDLGLKCIQMVNITMGILGMIYIMEMDFTTGISSSIFLVNFPKDKKFGEDCKGKQNIKDSFIIISGMGKGHVGT